MHALGSSIGRRNDDIADDNEMIARDMLGRWGWFLAAGELLADGTLMPLITLIC